MTATIGPTHDGELIIGPLDLFPHRLCSELGRLDPLRRQVCYDPGRVAWL